MKRRGFLGMLSAAGLAPLLPGGAVKAAAGGAAAAQPSRYAYGYAVFHARTRLRTTAVDVARRVGVSQRQAQKMITRMLQDGHIDPGPLPGTYTARSNILRPKGSPQLARRLAKLNAQGEGRRGFTAPDLSHVFRPILSMRLGVPTRFA